MVPMFLIVAHTDPVQFKRLVRRLSIAGPCLVHIDLKCNLADFEVENPRVRFASNRFDVSWAGVSQVECTLSLMREALDGGCDEVSHLVLLSGSCYPIRPLTDLREFLARNSDRDFLKLAPVRRGQSHFACLTKFWFYDDLPVGGKKLGWRRLTRGALQLACRWFDRTPPTGLTWYFGSNWWALRPDVARMVLRHERVAELLHYLRYSMASDEMFFHTLVADISGAHAVAPQLEAEHVSQVTNLHYIDPTLVRWFKAEDWSELTECDAWFVRKLSSSQSSALCDRLDEVSKRA
jgi:hypothetical protein